MGIRGRKILGHLPDEELKEILEMREGGISTKEIAVYLASKGYTTKTGKEIRQPTISKFCIANGLRSFRKNRAKRKIKKTTTTKARIESHNKKALVQTILESNLPAKVKTDLVMEMI